LLSLNLLNLSRETTVSIKISDKRLKILRFFNSYFIFLFQRTKISKNHFSEMGSVRNCGIFTSASWAAMLTLLENQHGLELRGQRHPHIRDGSWFVGRAGGADA